MEEPLLARMVTLLHESPLSLEEMAMVMSMGWHVVACGWGLTKIPKLSTLNFREIPSFHSQ